MIRHWKLVMVIVAFIVLTSLAIVPAVLAHNAAHVHPQEGVCIDVGAGNHAQNPEVQDKIPGPGDQFGARWAAEQSPVVYPFHCDDPRAQPHTH